eukprot:15483778-Alexandrium_andersonii.AAC.1
MATALVRTGSSGRWLGRAGGKKHRTALPRRMLEWGSKRCLGLRSPRALRLKTYCGQKLA